MFAILLFRSGRRLKHTTLVVAELAVDLNFFLDQPAEHSLVAAAVGLSDLRAEFPLATLQAAMFQRVQRAFHLVGERQIGRLRRVVERQSQVRARLVGGGRIERVVRRGRVGQRVEQIGGGEVGNPLWMVGDAGGRDPARRIALRKEWDPLESTCRHASLSIL